ncbi:UNVERIFIED_CONTAM: hypothetical protein FKN15_025878 [Acipenser sinensis]
MKCLREKGQGPRIDQYFLRSQSSQSNEIQRQEANHSSQDISTPVIDVRRTCMDTVSDEPNDPCEPVFFLDILLDFVRLEPEVQEKAITRGYPELIEALDRMTQMVDWVYQEREERERKVRRRRQRGNTDLEWEEPERPAPERGEPERPAPEWEEPERPAPEWEEPERPAPER